MATKAVDEMLPASEHWQAVQGSEYIGCSIGIMAHNEEANIGRTIHAVLAQQGPSFLIEEVIVVASGCTDRTVPIVSDPASVKSGGTNRGRLLETMSGSAFSFFMPFLNWDDITVFEPDLIEEGDTKAPSVW